MPLTLVTSLPSSGALGHLQSHTSRRRRSLSPPQRVKGACLAGDEPSRLTATHARPLPEPFAWTLQLWTNLHLISLLLTSPGLKLDRIPLAHRPAGPAFRPLSIATANRRIFADELCCLPGAANEQDDPQSFLGALPGTLVVAHRSDTSDRCSPARRRAVCLRNDC